MAKDNRPKARDLIDQADALIEKIRKQKKETKREDYVEALPLMMAMRTAATKLAAFVRSLDERADILSDKATAYALEHVTALDEPVHDVSVGKQCGSVTVGENVYTLTITPGPLKRTNGCNMTRPFLEDLPKDWTKNTLELDLTGIKRLGVSEEVLFKHGLIRVEKRAWTMKQAAKAEGVDEL